MQNPLKPEHREMLEYAKKRLAEVALILNKMGNCGDDCGEIKAVYDELLGKVLAYEEHFFGPTAWREQVGQS